MASIELGFLLLLLYLCRRRYRSSKERRARARDMRIFNPRSHENQFVVDPFAYSDPHEWNTMVSRQNSWKKNHFLGETDKQTMGHTENESSIQGLNRQRSDVRNDALYGARGLRPAVTNCRDQDTEGPLVHQRYPPKPQQTPYGNGTTNRNPSLKITPSREYLPLFSWQSISEVPPSPSIYPATLPVAEDDEPDHPLPTPTSIAPPKPAAFPNQGCNWGTSANKPRSYRVPVNHEAYMMAPLDSEDDRGFPAVARQKTPCDEPRLPPPIPPRSPLRRVLSAQTMLNVSFFTFPSSLSIGSSMG